MKTDYAGNCGVCNKTWNVGDELYLSKSADGTHWIKCTDKDCFTKQGGKIDSSDGKGGKFQSSKFKITEATHIAELTTALMAGFTGLHDKNNQLTVSDKAIMFESLFRTLSNSFKP